jgi:hypothetical protein
VLADWVDKTYWNNGSSGNPTTPVYDEVPAYLMMNVNLLYRFSGSWEGLEAAVSGFNVTGAHYETLPTTPTAAGLNAEIIATRWSGTLSYHFGL